MESRERYLSEQKTKLLRALAHLEYSYLKVQSLPEDPAKLDDETLETWESFSARFARVADLFLMRYLRAVVLQNDPGFAGTLRDFVNQAEKIGLIKDAHVWMAIRELRNISAHEYTDKDLAEFFKRLKQECSLLLQLKKMI